MNTVSSTEDSAIRQWISGGFYAVCALCLLNNFLFPFFVDYFKIALPFSVKLFLPQFLNIALLGISACTFRNIPLKEKFQWNIPSPFPVMPIVTAVLFLLVSSLSLGYAMYTAGEYLNIELPQQSLPDLIRKNPYSPQALMIIFSAVIIAPVTEECMFRRFFFAKVNMFFNYHTAAVITAATFSALHCNLLHAPALFVMGLILQGTMRKTGSLLTPILIHSLFNASNVLLIMLVHNLLSDI